MTTARRLAADLQTVKRHQWLDWGEIVRKRKGAVQAGGQRRDMTLGAHRNEWRARKSASYGILSLETDSVSDFFTARTRS